METNPTFSIVKAVENINEEFKNEWISIPVSLIIEPTDELGGIYLGNYVAAEDITGLVSNNVKTILTVTPELEVDYPNDLCIEHKIVKADDETEYNLSKHFDECFKFIDAGRSKKANVLVHCMAGVSRSASVVVAYMMQLKKWDLPTAYRYVKERRVIIGPNEGFVKQLAAFNDQLFKIPIKDANQNKSGVQNTKQNLIKKPNVTDIKKINPTNQISKTSLSTSNTKQISVSAPKVNTRPPSKVVVENKTSSLSAQNSKLDKKVITQSSNKDSLKK